MVLLDVGPTSDRARCCSGVTPPSSHSDSSLDSAIPGRSIKGNTSIGVIFTLMTNIEKAPSRVSWSFKNLSRDQDTTMLINPYDLCVGDPISHPFS